MRRKRGGKRLYIATVVTVLAGLVGYYVYTSESFERNAPKIEIANKIYWNLKKPLHLRLTDDSGIKSYKVVLTNGKEKVTIDQQTLTNPQKEIEIEVEPPVDMEFPKKRAQLLVEVQDKSYWHYFLGNSAQKRVNIHIDTKRPDLFVVNNTYSITKGGSALVVFHCSDENLKKFSIKTNFGKEFKAQPFYKDGYYIALLAWPLTKKSFRADIVAVDLAGNRAKVHIPLYLRNKRYKTSKIKLTDRFLEGKVVQLAEEYPETAKLTKLERFKFVNETLRQMNEKLIHTLSQKVPDEMVSDFDIKPFYPLKSAAKVASFGDHRFYYYNGKFVSESYHLGLDLASTKMAPLKLSNSGVVVYADYNGIYGNMPLISHGLGLYTLYAHCSTLFVKKGDEVAGGKVIAKTGRTGLALGDHLHFGVLVQGIEVRPEEWMDRKWIKLNIKNVIKEAKKLIDSK